MGSRGRRSLHGSRVRPDPQLGRRADHGRALAWYWTIGIPQAFIPFLVAERFYDETAAYDFEPLRFIAFLAIPVGLMVLTRLSYRGRVW